MARRVFYSFHYKADSWRASKIRNIGAIEGNRPVNSNTWESIRRAGAQQIQSWIHTQMHGRSCVVVLIGEHTAGRKWVNYEIKYGWEQGKAVMGIYIHRLRDQLDDVSPKGGNPFSRFTLGHDGPRLSSIVKAYSPPPLSSAGVYNHIRDNIEDWVEEALDIRGECD